MNGSLKYGGEAIFLLGISFRCLRWAMGALSEGDAPPSAYAPVPMPAAISSRPLGAAGQVAHTLMSDPAELTGSQNAWYRAGEFGAPPLPGDPALFPPEMLAAMTPEQRAHVMETLAKQRSGPSRS